MTEKKNLIYDTTLSSGDWTLQVIDEAKAKGYDIEVRVVAAHKLESEHGVDKRFTDNIDRRGHARYVPEGAREAIYDKVPASLDTIHASSDVPIRIFDREGTELYDSRIDPRPPGQVLEEARFARLQDPALTQQLRKGWDEQVTWHDELPGQVARKPIADPQTRENLLDQHRKLNVQEGVIARADGAATIDALVREDAPPARAPTPELPDPYPRLRGFNLGLAAEAAVSAYEWNDTHRRAQVFRDTLHNDAAAIDAYARQGAQTTGATAGAVAGGLTASALGLGTGGTFALVAAEGYLFATAAERAVETWQQEKIYSQTDREGVSWQFNGRQWLREDLRADLLDDGRDAAQRQAFSALPDKARELSAMASAEAVKQSLADVPEPRNPFVLPADDSDRHSLRTRDWNYQPESGKWLREVVTGLDHREMPSKFETIEADPARAARLSAQAVAIIDGNLQAGPAAIAAHYEIVYKARGYEQTAAGTIPPAVTTALDPDLLQASDGKHYRRDAQGAWTHAGEAASATRGLELELTRERLLPALEQHRTQLAEMPAWQPPTPEQQDRDHLRQIYLDKGLNPDIRPERFEAAYAALQQTRAEHGIGPGNTSLTLDRDAAGRFSMDSPIQHLQYDANGVVRIAATTTPEQIALAAPAPREAETLRQPERATPAEDASSAPPPQASDIRDERHLGHTRYLQALDAIERSPNIPSGAFQDERLQQASANLAWTSLAGGERPRGGQNERLERIDFAVLNAQRDGLIAGQGELGNPTAKLAYLPAAQDNATTLAHASQQVHDAVLQQRGQDQMSARQTPAPALDDPAPRAARLG